MNDQIDIFQTIEEMKPYVNSLGQALPWEDIPENNESGTALPLDKLGGRDKHD